MKRKTVAAIFSFAFLGPLGLWAQNVKVRSLDRGLPIPNVYIFSSDSTKSAVSNRSGNVELEKFSDQDTIIFKHSVYRPFAATKKEIVRDGKVVYLENGAVDLKAFVMHGPLRTGGEGLTPPTKLRTLDAREIENLNSANSADMLQATGQVLIQKSQLGGGSPIIRGFEANRVLMVVDGVRMNNAIYRGGHLQNAITVDNSVLQSTDIIFGPGSVIYGSDALGGVVHFHTKDPILSDSSKMVQHVGAYTRLSTANSSIAGHANVNLGWKKIGLFSAFTASNFGDLKMGQERIHGFDDFGKIDHFYGSVNGVDSTIVNDQSNVHVNSGYKQYDFLQKILWQPTEKWRLIGNFQFSNSSDIPRYDRLNDYSDSAQLKFAEWHYGPQKRLFGSVKAEADYNLFLFDKANIIFAAQRIDEDRINRRMGRSSRTVRMEDVRVYSLNIDFIKNLRESQQLFYGIEGTHNIVHSNAHSENIATPTLQRSAAASRYPDGGSTMSTFGAYLAYNTFLGDKFNFQFGARYNHSNLVSQFINQDFYPLPFNEIRFNKGALTGNAGVVYKVTSTLSLNAVVSSGFRSPNVDDYGKVFEKNGNVVVPNNMLTPEYAYNSEIGFTKRFEISQGNKKREIIRLQGVVYQTWLTNAIVRQDYSLLGQDSMFFDGEMAKIQTNRNAEQAHVYGANASLRVFLTKALVLNSAITYTKGRDVSNSRPLSHIPPLYGRTSIGFDKSRFNVQGIVVYNAWKRIDEYGAGTTDNPSEATELGTPSWYVINLKGGYLLNDQIRVQLELENILDHHYKPFSSGISGPGRNFIFTVRISI